MVTKLVVSPLVLVGILLGRAIDKMVEQFKASDDFNLTQMIPSMLNCNDTCAWFNMNIQIVPFPKTHIGIYSEFWPSDERQAEQTVAIMYKGYILMAIRPMWSSTYVNHVMHYVCNYQNVGNHDMAESEIISLICGTFREWFRNPVIPDGSQKVMIPPCEPLLVTHDKNPRDGRFVRFRPAGAYPIDKPSLVLSRHDITDQQAAVMLGCTVAQLASFVNKEYTIVHIDPEARQAHTVYKHDFRWWYYVLDTRYMPSVHLEWVFDYR